MTPVSDIDRAVVAAIRARRDVEIERLTATEKPDAGTALGLAMIARERREREQDRAIDELDVEDTLARRLNAESGEYLPPLAVAILADTLNRSQRARLAVLAPKFRPASMGYEDLTKHFEALGGEVQK